MTEAPDWETQARELMLAGQPVPCDVARAVLALLDEARAESALRFTAIGKLAPAAKSRREQAQTLARLALIAADALACTDETLSAQLTAAATAALPDG